MYRSDWYRSHMDDWVVVISIVDYVDWLAVGASYLPVRATQSAHGFHLRHGVNVRCVNRVCV